MKNSVRLLNNGEIYELSKTMSMDALVKKVHETQPGLTKNAIKRIVVAQKKSSRPIKV